MAVYKFMRKEHVSGFLSGKILFRPFSYYWDSEIDNPDFKEGGKDEEWISDRMEGISEVAINYTYSSSDLNAAEARRQMEKFGYFTDEWSTGTVTFKDGYTTIAHRPAYIFCFSAPPFENVRKAMCDDAPTKDRYDACVEIKGPEELQRAIFNGSVDGVPVQKLFKSVNGGWVSYTKKIEEFSPEGGFDPNLFVKPPFFQHQQELRIVLEPRGDIETDMLFVDIDEAKSLFREVTVRPFDSMYCYDLTNRYKS